MLIVENSSNEKIGDLTCQLNSGISEISDYFFSERKRASAALLHVDQLEKIIAKLRNNKELSSPVRLGGSNTSNVASSVSKAEILEATVEKLESQIEECNDKILFLSNLIQERDSTIVKLQEDCDEKDAAFVSLQEAISLREGDTLKISDSIQILNSKLTESESLNVSLENNWKAAKLQVENIQEELVRQTTELQEIISDKDTIIEELSNSIESEKFANQDVLNQFAEHMDRMFSLFSEHVTESFACMDQNSEKISLFSQHCDVMREVLRLREQDVEAMAKEIADKDVQLEAVTNEGELSKQYLKARTDELAEMKQRFDNLHQEMAKLGAEKADIESELSSKIDELNKLLSQVKEAQERALLLQEGFETISDQIERYKTENERLEQLVEDKNSEIVSLRQTAGGSENELHDRIKELENEIITSRNLCEEEKRKHHEEMTTLQQDIDTFRGRIAEMDDLLPQLHFQLTEAQRVRTELTEKCKHLEAQLAYAQSNSRDPELQSRSDEFEKVSHLCDQMKSKNEMLKQQLLERESEIEELASKMASFEDDFKQIVKEKDDKIKELEDRGCDFVKTRDQLASRVANLEQLLDSQGDSSANEIATLSDKCNELQSLASERLEMLENNQEHFQHSSKQLEDRIASLEHDKSSLEVKLNESLHRLEEKENLLKLSEQNLKDWTNQCEQLKSHIAYLEQTLNGQSGSQSEELRKMAERCAELENLVAQKDQQMEQLQADFNEWARQQQQSQLQAVENEKLLGTSKENEQREEMEKLRNQLVDLAPFKERCNELSKVISEKEGQIGHLQNLYDSKCEDMKKLASKMEQVGKNLIKERDELKHQLHNADARLQHDLKQAQVLNETLTKAVEDGKTEIQLLKNSVEASGKNDSQLKQDLESTLAKLVDKEKALDSLHSDFNKLQASFQLLQQECYSHQQANVFLQQQVQVFHDGTLEQFQLLSRKVSHLQEKFNHIVNQVEPLIDNQRKTTKSVGEIVNVVKYWSEAQIAKFPKQVLEPVDSRMSSLEQRIDLIKEAFEKCSKQASIDIDAEAKVKSLVETNENSVQTVGDLVERSQVDDLNALLLEKEEELAQLTAKLQDYRLDEIATLNQQIEELERQLEAARLNEQRLVLEYDQKVSFN